LAKIVFGHLLAYNLQGGARRGIVLRRILFSTLLVFVCSGAPASAFAAAYDDFARGVAANLQGDSTLAISSYTAAITAGDLAPALLPEAYRGRALAYLRAQKCAAARTDADAALALKPADDNVRILQANIAMCLGQLDLALAGYSAVIATRPGLDVYTARGFLYWRKGDYTSAAADFAQVVRLAPKFSYGVIWFALAQARTSALDAAQVKNAASRVDEDGWPAPILSLLTGSATADAVEAAAARGEGNIGLKQKCEADFYVAEWWLGRGDAASAKPLLESAAANCPHGFVEYAGAKIELARLK
jgi:lipoprotein NlpI